MLPLTSLAAAPLRTSGRILITLLGCAILPLDVLAQTSTVVQTTPFSFSISGTESGSGAVNEHTIAPVGSFTTTLTPFDSSLGTLVSFTLDWEFTVTGAVDVANGMQIGSFGSGNLEIAGVAYYGTGGGNGGASSASFTMGSSKTFLVADAGVNYDVNIYNAVTGATNYTAYFDTGTSVGPHDYVDGEHYEGTTTGSVTMTYTYSAVPEPSTCALLAGASVLLAGLIRRRRAEA